MNQEKTQPAKEHGPACGCALCFDQRMKFATPKHGMCECCASASGIEMRVANTRRVICNACAGFIARWWVEMEEASPPKPRKE